MTKGLKVAGLAVAVGVVTYFGLELLLPHHKVEVSLEGLAPADSVFGKPLKSGDEVAADTTTATPDAAPTAAADGAAATTPSGPAFNTDDATADAPSGPAFDGNKAAPAAAASAASSAEPAAAAAPAEVAQAEPAPAEAPAAAAPPEPVAAPEEAKPAPAPTPAKPKAEKAESAAPAKPAAAASAKHGAPSSPWWQMPGEGLRVIYVGSAAYKRAIVVMANAPFADAAAAKSIRVTDGSGKAVSGSWEVNANNKTMLVLPVTANGNYKVTIDGALSDAQSRKLGKTLKGGVLVQ